MQKGGFDLGKMIKSKFESIKSVKDMIFDSIGALKGKILTFKGNLLKAKGNYIADKGQELIAKGYSYGGGYKKEKGSQKHPNSGKNNLF